MLVGHSEGGIVAVNAARDAVAAAGSASPTSSPPGHRSATSRAGSRRACSCSPWRTPPTSCPHLDGAPNPDRRNVVTVRGREQHGGISANHDLEQSYLPEAVDAQTAGNGSIDAFLPARTASCRARTMTTHAYQITRAP